MMQLYASFSYWFIRRLDLNAKKSAKYVIFLPHSRHITGILYAMNSSGHNIEWIPKQSSNAASSVAGPDILRCALLCHATQKVHCKDYKRMSHALTVPCQW